MYLDYIKIIIIRTYDKFNIFSCTRVICAQYYVKSEYYWRKAYPAVVVMGELCVYLYLFHTLHITHDYVLISVDHHHTQIEIYQKKTATKYTTQCEKKVRSHEFINYIYVKLKLLNIKSFISLNII